MGYGGWLLYSAAVENAKRAYPEKKIIVIYPVSIRSIFKSKNITDAQMIFDNNPHIHRMYSSFKWFFIKYKFLSKNYLILNFSDKKFHHHEQDTKERITYKKGKHAIEYACESLNIPKPELKPYLYLRPPEIERSQKHLDTYHLKPTKYLCIEPGTKSDFTPNKAWPIEYWEEFYEKLHAFIQSQKLDIQIVQIGSPQTARLKNCIYLNGQLSFRETFFILKNSIFLISYVGGLTHLARASGCTNVVLKSAWEPKELTSYPGDIEFYTNVPCKHCGLKTPCPINIKCMREILPEDVFNQCKYLLSKENMP